MSPGSRLLTSQHWPRQATLQDCYFYVLWETWSKGEGILYGWSGLLPPHGTFQPTFTLNFLLNQLQGGPMPDQVIRPVLRLDLHYRRHHRYPTANAPSSR